MDLLQKTMQQLLTLPTESQVALLGLFKRTSFKKHEFLVEQGAYARTFALVEQGVLRAFYQNSKGEQYNKTFFETGDFVGAFASLVTQLPNKIDIQCLTDCTLLIANYEAFTALFDAHPKIERLARILAEQYFVQKEKREIELVTLNAVDRYAIFQEEHPLLEQQIPQYHIASYLGVTATQLSRIRAKK